MSVPISLIAAIGDNHVIGQGDALPWRIPSDFAFFKRTTLGKPVIMGRATFEGIGRPLPGRTNIIVSRRPDYAPEGVLVATSLDEAIDRAQQIAADEGAGEVMIGGGASIYEQAIGSADRLYITHVALSPEGDALFPSIDMAVWAVVAEPDIVPDPRDAATYRIKIYARR